VGNQTSCVVPHSEVGTEAGPSGVKGESINLFSMTPEIVRVELKPEYLQTIQMTLISKYNDAGTSSIQNARLDNCRGSQLTKQGL